LGNPRVVDKAAIEKIVSRNQVPKREPVLVKTEANGEALSAQIKRSMSVLDFVSQYVELASNGRGLCPFHDDQNASFAVNPEKNYWHCFAGCGGGSLIDFYMKLKGVDFKDAVHDLAEMLLVEQS
jgi:DNA primase